MKDVENPSELEYTYSGVISVTNPIYSTNIEFAPEEQAEESVAKDTPLVRIETAIDLQRDIRVAQGT